MAPDLTAAEAWLATRSAAERKGLGQWATPWWLVQAVIAHLAQTTPLPRRVLDPACGDGRWLIAAARAWPHAQLFGLDIDSGAIDVARRTLTLAGVHAELSCVDALAAEAPVTADLVVGNPPYVRPQHLARDRARDLWARFQVATDKADLYACFVEQGGQLAPRAAWVLPSTWMSMASFAALRRWLEHRGVDGVYGIGRDAFPDATVDAVLLVVGPDDRRHAGTVDSEGVRQTGALHTGPHAWSIDGAPPQLEGRPLGELATVHMGVVCGDYPRYVHRGRLHPEDRPTCRGKHVQRWSIDATDEHLRYLPREMLDRKPYVAPKHAGLFDVARKIVLAGSSGRTLRAALDTERRFPLDSCYVVHPRDGVSLDGLLGLLLSTPVGAWYGARHPAARVKGIEVKRIPLPRGSWSRIAAAAREQDDAGVDAAVLEAYAGRLGDSFA